MFCCSKKKENKIYPLEDIFEPRPKSILKNNKKQNKKNKQKKTIKEKKDKISENKSLIEENNRKKQEFTELFLSEIIECGACNDKISLRSGKLKINCASCNKFMCCHIAGACIGPNCSAMVDGEKHSLKYCMSCVNPYLKINIMNNGQCLCKSCEKSSDIPNYYKEI